MTRRVHRFSSVEGVFTTTEQGLYRSRDGGDSWTDCGVPEKNVYSVIAIGETLYVGVRPAAIYRSENDGETWDELIGFRKLPSYGLWPTNPHRDTAHVRTLAAHPGAPERVVAGVEVAGVFVSDDSGETWRECHEGLPRADPNAGFQCDDVHHVTMLNPDEWLVASGGGILRTSDVGETWTRLDTGGRWYSRESLFDGRKLYTAANRTPPFWDPVDAALFVSKSGYEEFESVQYPGAPNVFIISWTTGNGRVFAGANNGAVFQEVDDEWKRIGCIPVPEMDQGASGVTSLAVM